MNTITESRIERLSRLASIPDEEVGDAPPRRPATARPTGQDGAPVVPILAVLQAEVARCEARLEAARADLRQYMLSHDASEARG